MRNLAVIVLLVTACGSEKELSPMPAPTTKPVLVNATQQDLAREVDEADRRGTWSDVKRRWQGQTLRWNVTRHRALCGSAELCNVSAFPVQRPAQHGWLPELKFAAGQYAALEAHCAGTESCDVSIEGTLDQLDLSGEMPTNLRIGGVRIVMKTARR